MAAQTQDVPGYYVWDVLGQPVIVHLRLDVVDRLASEVMRGLGAIPKRGAEVGGVLLGTVQNGFPAIVRVEDFEAVACEYRRGPAYLFTDADGVAFRDACQRWQPGVSPSSYAVGYFRSHTREGFSLGANDIDLLDYFFASPSHVALLIKPYATRASVAGFFAREHGVFPETTPLEFPLRRRELNGEEAPPRRPMLERRPPTRGLAPAAEGEKSDGEDSGFVTTERVPAREVYAATAAKSRRPRRWLWIPLSVISLLVGVVLGFQAALTMGKRIAGATSQEFSLSLSVTKNDDTLNVRWDGQAPAIRSANRGLLEIEDGGYTKPVDLDAAQLQHGNLIYRNTSTSVRFRLTVYPRARVSITETLQWRQ